VYIDHAERQGLDGDVLIRLSTDSEYRDNDATCTDGSVGSQTSIGEQALTRERRSAVAMGRTEATANQASTAERCACRSRRSCSLLDVSHSLLNAAYRHCCETLPDIRTYTIHGSFLDLPKMPMLVNPLRGRSRLFAMLGWHAASTSATSCASSVTR
jgi:hypothetical protein